MSLPNHIPAHSSLSTVISREISLSEAPIANRSRRLGGVALKALSRSGLTMLTAGLLCLGNAHAQQVALLDSGVDPNSGFNVAQGFNYFNNSSDTSDVSNREGEGHGTVSVRLVSEAFSGEIVPYVVTDGSRDASSTSRVRGARDSALSDILGQDEIRVVGITWGTEGVVTSSAPLISNLSAANKVIAIQSGNNFAAQPTTLASSSFNLSGVIIVGAVTPEGFLAPATNLAGTTAEKFVGAIGLPEPGAEVGGSSWAAARIAGIAGAVFQQNPDLTAQQVVEVILESAEDRGEPGTDSEYGRGVILSAEQVLNNVMGPVTVPTPESPPVTPPSSGGGGGGGGGAGGALLLGGAVAGALLLLRKPATKLEKTLVLDSYGRTFQLDLSKQVVINDGALHMNEFVSSLNRKVVTDGFTLPKVGTEVAFMAIGEADDQFDMIEYFAMPDDVVIADSRADVSVAMATRLSQRFGLTSGYQVSARQEFGAAKYLHANDDFGKSSFLTGQTFASVLSGFGARAETMSLAFSPKKSSNTAIKLGLVSVDQNQRFGQNSMSTLLEGNYQFNDNAGVSLQFGQIEEQGSLFGGSAGGVFGVDSAVTYALNMAGHIKTSERFSIVANYGLGRTKVASAKESLLNDFSQLKSDWYSIGLVGNGIFHGRDQIGLAFSQPLKIRNGSVDYSIPTGRNQFGAIAFDSERVNLAETNATERNLEIYYRTMLNNKLELGGFASYRQNPNHVSDHGDDAIAMLTVRYWQ